MQDIHIELKFSKRSDAEMVLDRKKKLRKGIYVDQFYGVETEKQRKRLRPILSAARRLEEYRGRCKMEGTEVIIRGKHYSFNNLSELPENLSLDKYHLDKMLHTMGSLANLTHYQTSILHHSHVMEKTTIILSSSSKQEKRNFVVTMTVST